MNIEDYLQRIQYHGPRNVTPETLHALQQAHVLHVPFENLDIHLGEPINLRHTYAKVVDRRRGGFCYELNSLFCELLVHLGFDAHLVSACVFHQTHQTFGPEYDHMAIAVHFDDASYLADVGFGEFSWSAIPIVPGHVHEDTRGIFLLHYLDPDRYLIKKETDGHEVPQYHFSLSAQKPEDFFEMCAWHQTSPESHFTQKRLCTLPTSAGRITLRDTTLTIREGERYEEVAVKNEEDFRLLLQTYFNIDLPHLTD